MSKKTPWELAQETAQGNGKTINNVGSLSSISSAQENNKSTSGKSIVNNAKSSQPNTMKTLEPLKKGYVESDAVTAAYDKLNALQKPGEYNSQWQNGLNDIINKIMNREKFSYDLNGDALYQQYKDQYVTRGQQAMMDTMGQAAALTGGYGNSYAQSVGQQTYQGYLQQLNDKIPELYQLALDQYNREGEDMYNQYGLLADRDNTEYGRYRDTVSDYNTERDYLASRYDTERGFDYGQYRDNVADKQWQTQFDRDVLESDRAYDYQVGRDEVADKQWQSEFDESVRQFDTTTQMQKEQWQAEFDEGIRQFEKNYQLTVQQIQEDIRHNKITEAQGQAQIDLAKQELAQQQEEFKQEMAYKYAALNKSSSSSGGSGGGSSGSGSSKSSGSSGGSTGGSSGSGNGNSGGGSVTPTKTKNTTSFIANNMTKSEFMARGKTYKEYKAHIESKLNSANLTPSEFAYLESYYELN